MINVSKKVEYSLALVTYLARYGEKPVSLKMVSEKVNLPYRFLAQLASTLKQGGILVSKEGKTGGYLLAENWAEKNLYDLLTVLGEANHMVECLGGSDCVLAKSCSVRSMWQKLEDGFVGELKKINLAEIK